VSRGGSYAVAVLVLATLAPAASYAQVRRPQVPPSPIGQLTFRGFGDAGVTVLSATQSFKAILGRPDGPLFGGGVELGLSTHLFVSVAASRFRRTGHRVFAFQGQVFDLNEPATITITPLEITLGYRHTRLAQPGARAAAPAKLIPYFGGGVGFHKYTETSAHSTDADEVHARFTGYHVLGGLEIPVQKWMALAAEAQFASVPNALGKDPNGVSSVYNEHDLGGFTFRMKVAVGR
jgi:opacity protein-like surface antigen